MSPSRRRASADSLKASVRNGSGIEMEYPMTVANEAAMQRSNGASPARARPEPGASGTGTAPLAL